jgi:hypothetical protein
LCYYNYRQEDIGRYILCYYNYRQEDIGRYCVTIQFKSERLVVSSLRFTIFIRVLNKLKEVKVYLILYLTDLFLNLQQTSCRGFSNKNGKKPALSLTFTFHYANDVLSQNNSTSLETHADCIYHKGPLNLK